MIGVPDDEYGEIVTAIVVADGALTADDVIAYAREHLVAYKCPRRVELVDRAPARPDGQDPEARPSAPSTPDPDHRVLASLTCTYAARK